MAWMRWLARFGGALAVAVMLAGGASAGNGGLVRGREATEAFLHGEFGQLWDSMTEEMRAALGSREALREFRERLAADFGDEAKTLSENAGPDGNFEVYLRRADWTEAPAPVLTEIAFNGAGRIAGFHVHLEPRAAESRFLDYRTKAKLRLPFDGDWFVFWGGRGLADNYHAGNRAQRFAMDAVIREGGSSHAGDPQALESYHCWGRSILAPADATVVAVVSDLPDQPIGGSDPAHPAGNHVVLDFGTGEFGFLAHLRRGSQMVSAGDRVAAGEPIGRCGNSGNTSEPHLHFHLQTTPELATGEGLPAQFLDYAADGRPVPRGEPRRGETVTPAG